jgi:S-adenosylmethionine:tRNA ribosyltransferase-isomerase
MQVDLFDYELPPDRIAQRPAAPRDASRLLVLHRRGGRIEHRTFRQIGEFLNAGDVLVVNDARVLPARLVGRRTRTGGKWEGLFLRETGEGWELLTKTRGKPAPGETVQLDRVDWGLELLDRRDAGVWLARPTRAGPALELLEEAGRTPLPPYIRAGVDEPEDRERYQTVFAASPGAVAAPTAGLHFTPELLERLEESGVEVERVTLHVGPGTFQPVSVADADQHRMHSEWCQIDDAAAQRICEARRRGGRVVAVGTTVVRTLETSVRENGRLSAYCGSTDLFIRPPFEFQAVDAMATNFHLPRSTLLMLVSAFAGRTQVLEAYQEAIREGYRFYSYGDAMLIL